MRIGEKEEIQANNGARAYLRRKSSDSYCLVAADNPYRARWGTIEEIRNDLDHFMVFGALPPADLPSW